VASEEQYPGSDREAHHVAVVGGGFGGLWAVKAMKRAPVKVTLIDRRNFHLFQPLLYQIATGGLSPADIASPLRGVFGRQKNVRVILGEVTDFDLDLHTVMLKNDTIEYDSLIIAAGTENNFFGNDKWEDCAPGLKGIEDALRIRRNLYVAFELAEKEDSPESRKRLLTFAIVGGGPTGVELAGALGEIANISLRNDFRKIDTADTRIVLIEAGRRILPSFPEDLARKAQSKLEKLGVEVLTDSKVIHIDAEGVTIVSDGESKRIGSRSVMWSAGVKPSALGKAVAKNHPEPLDDSGRVIVEPDLSIRGYPDVFVIGDLANFRHQTGEPLPGLAPVAMSEGRYVANLISKRLKGKSCSPYRYRSRGNMAVIGRAAAIADLGWAGFSGYPAWLLWLFIHLMYLVEYDNRLLVFIQWAWNYFTRKRGARLITYDLNGKGTQVGPYR
jgi:NADH dehydrogenase